ncbi:hypothetical protein [Streptomyces sp. NPDC002078]
MFLDRPSPPKALMPPFGFRRIQPRQATPRTVTATAVCELMALPAERLDIAGESNAVTVD